VSTQTSEILATGVLSEANVVLGLTTTELVMVIVTSLLLWTPILLLLGVFVFGNVMVSVGFVLILTLMTSILAGKRMQSIKRGKPEGHYKQMVYIKLSKTKLIGSHYILVDGPLALGRTTKVIRESHLV